MCFSDFKMLFLLKIRDSSSRWFFLTFVIQVLLFLRPLVAKEVISPSFSLICVIRFIPQGTVDNNLGSERLAGPKALDPIYCQLYLSYTYISLKGR